MDLNYYTTDDENDDVDESLQLSFAVSVLPPACKKKRRKKHAYGKPRKAQTTGNAKYVGLRVKIFWEGENQYFVGSVIKMIKDKYLVAYDDNSMQVEDLHSSSVIWEIVKEEPDSEDELPLNKRRSYKCSTLDVSGCAKFPCRAAGQDNAADDGIEYEHEYEHEREGEELLPPRKRKSIRN
jgi:hypothetical protein